MPSPLRLEDAALVAETAWPALEIVRSCFAEHLATRVSAEADPVHELHRLAIADLYLACGLQQGDRAAIAAFESELLLVVIDATRRIGGAGQAAEDLAQDLAMRLLVGDGEREPRIASYSGRGSLRRWLQVTAARTQITYVGSLPRNRRQHSPTRTEPSGGLGGALARLSRRGSHLGWPDAARWQVVGSSDVGWQTLASGCVHFRRFAPRGARQAIYLDRRASLSLVFTPMQVQCCSVAPSCDSNSWSSSGLSMTM